jgi:pyruvate/oxaloacetate carboxyltransferase
MGYSADLDEDALAAVSNHFRMIAEKDGLPIGVPREYDLFHFEHQVPGGMMSNLTRQLREIGMEHRLEEILGEIVEVRRELGYPVMATPYSQIVGAQAIENILSGERYKQITDEVIKYALGYYGEPVVPVDQNVMDKVMSSPRSREFLDWQPEGYLKTVEELRAEIGAELSDDDLLLRVVIPGVPLKRSESTKGAGKPLTKPTVSVSLSSADLSTEFNMEVNGEAFSVKIRPISDRAEKSDTTAQAETLQTLKMAKKTKGISSGTVP